MAETITALYALDGEPTRGTVADVLAHCAERFPDDHPHYDDLALPASEVGDAARDVLDGELVAFQYGTTETEGPQAFDYRVGVSRTDWTDCPSVTVLVNDAYFRTESAGVDEDDARRASAALREFLRDLYVTLTGSDRSVGYACAIDRADAVEHRENRPIVTEAGLSAGRLEGLAWYQVLPPDLAASVGRERLHDAPAWRVEDLDDGAVALVVDELPKLPRAGLTTNRDAVAEHLGVE